MVLGSLVDPKAQGPTSANHSKQPLQFEGLVSLCSHVLLHYDDYSSDEGPSPKDERAIDGDPFGPMCE